MDWSSDVCSSGLLSAAGFLVFIGSWSEFLVPLVIPNSRDVAVMSVGLYSFFGMDTTVYHYAFSASIMSTLPVIVAYLFAHRYLISGIARGSEKRSEERRVGKECVNTIRTT